MDQGEYHRSDGRSPSAMRNLRVEFGGLSRSDGSSTFGFGSEQVIGSFYGPLEADRRDEQIDRATLRINHRPLDTLPGTSSKALAAALEPMFLPLISSHAHPKTLLQLTLQSTASSSSLNYTSMSARAACINASTLAILDAGSMNMTAVPVAVAVAAVPTVERSRRWDTEASFVPFEEGVDEQDAEEDDDEEVTLVLDPTAEEEKKAKSRFVIAWAFGAGMERKGGESADGKEAECALIESDGSFDEVVFQKAYNASRAACSQIIDAIRQTAEAKIKRADR